MPSKGSFSPMPAGSEFGRLTVISLAEIRHRKAHYLCLCACGNYTTVNGTHLRRLITVSCGCLQKELIALRNSLRSTHGQSRTSTYQVWMGMKARCDDTTNKTYGGRGIRVHPRWRTFSNFFEDMGERPPDKTLDRINTNGHYTPNNCRWATKQEQIDNRRVCWCPHCEYHKRLYQVKSKL